MSKTSQRRLGKLQKKGRGRNPTGYKSQLKKTVATLSQRNGELLNERKGLSSPEEVLKMMTLVMQAIEDVFGENSSTKVVERMNELAQKHNALQEKATGVLVDAEFVESDAKG